MVLKVKVHKTSGLVLSIALLCIPFYACGTTGNTNRFALNLDLGKPTQITSDVRVKSAAMEEGAAKLINVRVKPWGKFAPEDLKNLEQSLSDTIKTYVPAEKLPGLDIHVMIRRYIVSTSNTGGAVLACVAWAATDSQGKLIFEEQFYASDAAYIVGTIGLLKDSVHECIVRRIAVTALALASGSEVADKRPRTFINTSESLEDASSRLPSQMISLGAPPLLPHLLPITMVGILTPSGISKIEWKSTKPSENFDWQGYLKKLYSIP